MICKNRAGIHCRQVWIKSADLLLGSIQKQVHLVEFIAEVFGCDVLGFVRRFGNNYSIQDPTVTTK